MKNKYLLKYTVVLLIFMQFNFWANCQIVIESFTVQGQLLDANNQPIAAEGISYQLSNPDIPWTGSLQLLGVATDNNGKYSGTINLSSVPIGVELFVNSIGTTTSAPFIELFINSGATSISGPIPIHSVPTSLVSKRALNADNSVRFENKTLAEVSESFENGYGVPIGGIMMYSGIIDGSLFDGTGKGISGSRVENWALCNGSNDTPDLRGRFVVGRSDSSPLSQPGDGGEDGMQSGYINTEGNRPEYALVGGTLGNGGAYNVTLTSSQSGLPPHTHPITLNADSHGWGFNRIVSGQDETVHEVAATAAQNDPQNAQEAHENRPPFYTLAFIKRIK